MTGSPTHAAANTEGEYALKSAFLYNFSLFTTWPEQGFTPFNLCIYGQDPFGRNLDTLLQDKKINERTITVHRMTQLEQLAQCQLVFISPAEKGNLPKIIDSLAKHPILTVADTPDASLQGVMLNMNIKHDKITFEANLAQAKKANLQISAHLLRLATKVH